VECSLERGLVCKGTNAQDGICLDYEIRVYCQCEGCQHCSQVYAVYIPLSTGWCTVIFSKGGDEITTKTPEAGYCDPARPNRPVTGKCGEFEQCVPRLGGSVEWVGKVCGPGTWYNPITMTCDWPQAVALIRNDCKAPIASEFLLNFQKKKEA
jgi:hypothetical protein